MGDHKLTIYGIFHISHHDIVQNRKIKPQIGKKLEDLMVLV